MMGYQKELGKYIILGANLKSFGLWCYVKWDDDPHACIGLGPFYMIVNLKPMSGVE